LEFNVPFQHKYGYIRDDVMHVFGSPTRIGFLLVIQNLAVIGCVV